MFPYILAMMVVALAALWFVLAMMKKSARKAEILRLINDAKAGNKRKLLRLYRERAFNENKSREFGLGEEYRSLIASISREISSHPQMTNGWVADNLENTTFSDFEHLTTYFQLPKGALRRRFTTALRTRDRLELLICAAYYDECTYQVRQDVGDVLCAEMAKMLDEVTAEKEKATVSK